MDSKQHGEASMTILKMHLAAAMLIIVALDATVPASETGISTTELGTQDPSQPNRERKEIKKGVCNAK